MFMMKYVLMNHPACKGNYTLIVGRSSISGFVSGFVTVDGTLCLSTKVFNTVADAWRGANDHLIEMSSNED